MISRSISMAALLSLMSVWGAREAIAGSDGWETSFFQGREVSGPNIDSFYSPSACVLSRFDGTNTRSFQLTFRQNSAAMSILDADWPTTSEGGYREIILRVDGQTVYDIPALDGGRVLQSSILSADYGALKDALTSGAALTIEFPADTRPTWLIPLRGIASAFEKLDACLADLRNPSPDAAKPVSPF